MATKLTEELCKFVRGRSLSEDPMVIAQCAMSEGLVDARLNLREVTQLVTRCRRFGVRKALRKPQKRAKK